MRILRTAAIALLLGHKGRTLKMTSTPDNILDVHPDYCRKCGSSLENAHAIRVNSRQVVDIPPIKAVWTEYQIYSKDYTCGCRTISNFPKGVSSPVSYGSNIEGLIGYFHARQEVNQLSIPIFQKGFLLHTLVRDGWMDGWMDGTNRNLCRTPSNVPASLIKRFELPEPKIQ